MVSRLSRPSSPDERTLAIGNSPGRILLFDTRTRQRVATLQPTPKDAEIFDVAYSHDGSRLAIVHLDHPEARHPSLAATVLDVRARRSVTKLTLPVERPVSGIRFSADDRTIGVMAFEWSRDGAAMFTRFDVNTGRPISGPVRVNRRGWSPLITTSDGRRMVVVGEVTLRDATTLAVLRRISGIGLSAYPRVLHNQQQTV